MDITLEQAEKIIAAAKTKAKEIDTLMNITVVDRGAHLVAFARMDGAWLGSLDIAIKKAKTAKLFERYRSIIATGSLPVQYRTFQWRAHYLSRRCAC